MDIKLEAKKLMEKAKNIAPDSPYLGRGITADEPLDGNILYAHELALTAMILDPILAHKKDAPK